MAIHSETRGEIGILTLDRPEKAHAYARAHLVENYPIMIAGSAGGALKKGMHYRSVASENTSKVILSLARAMGLDLASFGSDAAMTTEGLSAIEAG